MKITTPRVRTQLASDLVNLDTYTREDRLIFSKADGDKSYVGRVYAASPLVGSGSEFSNVIVNTIKAMPDDSVIQVSLVCEPDHSAPITFGKNKNHGSSVVTELIERQQGVLKAALSLGWKDDLPALNTRRVLICAAVPIGRISPEVIDEAKQLHAEFLGNIKGCGFVDATALSAEELVGTYRQFADIFTPARPVELDELVDIKFQIFGPDESLDFRDQRVGVLNENTYCAGVTCKAFPPRVNHGLMNLVSGAPFNAGPTRDGGGQRIATPYILTTTIRVGNQRKEINRVTRAIDSRKHNQKMAIKLGEEDPVAKLNDLTVLQKQCSVEGNKFVYVSTTMFVFGRSHDQVIKAASAVKGTLDKLGFDGRPIVGNGIVRWAQTLPLNFSPRLANELASEAVMSASAAGCLLPVYGDYLGNATARSEFTGSAFVTRRGSAYYFDPFVSDSNANGTLSAMSGAGKSFNVQYFILTQLAQGTHVFALDNGRGLKKFCYAVGGEFNEFGDSSGFTPSLNPFSGLSDDEFDEQQVTITSLLLLMAHEGETAGNASRIALTEAVKAAWGQKAGKAGIEDVVEALRSTQASGAENALKNEVIIAAGNLIPRLTAFIESPSRGKYFTGEGTLDPKQQFTVFELGALGDDEHLKKCVLFFVLNLLVTRIKTIRGRKMIVVDEAHDLLKDPSAEAVMEGIYLKCRKERVSTWIVIQSLLKLVDMPAGRVILNQSAWKMVMAQMSEEIEKVLEQKVISAFASDPYFTKLLRSVETVKGDFSEILIFSTKTYEVVRLYVDRMTATLFSSEGDDRDAVFDLMSRGMNAMEAVRTVMGDTKGKRAKWLKSIVDQLRGHDGLTPSEILSEISEVME